MRDWLSNKTKLAFKSTSGVWVLTLLLGLVMSMTALDIYSSHYMYEHDITGGESPFLPNMISIAVLLMHMAFLVMVYRRALYWHGGNAALQLPEGLRPMGWIEKSIIYFVVTVSSFFIIAVFPLVLLNYGNFFRGTISDDVSYHLASTYRIVIDLVLLRCIYSAAGPWDDAVPIYAQLALYFSAQLMISSALLFAQVDNMTFELATLSPSGIYALVCTIAAARNMHPLTTAPQSTSLNPRPQGILTRSLIYVFVCVVFFYGLYGSLFCLIYHICMGGHMEHPPYESWHYMLDISWAGALIMSSYIALRTRLHITLPLILITAFMIITRFVFGSGGGIGTPF